MGRVGKQAQGLVSPSYGVRKASLAGGNPKLEQDGGRYRKNPGHKTGGSVICWSRLRSWLRATHHRSRMESEMDAGLRFHIEALAADLVRSGVSRQEALRRARLEFGAIERVKEEGRKAHGISFVD